MSLRTQIHSAIDDVAPSAPMLERRVRAFVLSDGPDRNHLIPRRQPRWVAPLGLIAAALVLALVAGLFIGGRFWRTQNAPPSTVGQNELKYLESRPLNYRLLAPGAACPVTQPKLNPQIGMLIGDGPVYLGNRDVYEGNDWGFWVAAGFAVDVTHPGLILVRARDLKSDAQIAFANYPLAPTPMTAVGPVLGTTRVANHQVQMRSEGAIPDPSTWPPYPKLGKNVELVVLLGMQKASSGCVGFQIDAAGFTENFVVNPAIPAF